MTHQIERFQYITHPQENIKVIDQVKAACDGGVKWIQLRLKELSDEVFMTYSASVKEVCDNYQCRLIINDRVAIAKVIQADGVHLGKKDMLPENARKILGTQAIIGGTANTLADIEFLMEQQVDYIGLGPYRFTTTKENLSPVIGACGYTDFYEALSVKGISIPIVAIGGILSADMDILQKTGVHGVAVSGALGTRPNEIEQRAKFFIEHLALWTTNG